MSGPHIFGGNFEDLPEPIKQMIQQGIAHAELHEMHDDAFNHQLHEWIEKLDPENLIMLKRLIGAVSDSNIGAYLVGIITHILQVKYDVCPVCGKPHDDSLSSLVSQAEQEMDWPTFVERLPDAVTAKLEEYHMNLVAGEWPKVVCAKCGLEYASIDDRMRRGVDECMGCVDKGSWG